MTLISLIPSPMKLRVLVVLAVSASLLTGCEELTNRDKLQKAGETVGRSATVIVDGIGEGIKRADKRQIALSEDLTKRGLRTGKFKVDKAETPTGGKEPEGDNRLTVYCIFDKDFKRTVTVTLFDEAGEEYGRTRVPLTGKSGDAHNVDFVFDPRTDIERGSKITIE